MNSSSLGKNRSHLEPGQRIWSQVSSSTGCRPKFRLWTTPSPTVFAIHVRSAWQMAGWKTRATILLQWYQSVGETLDQAHFSCRGSMLKSDKIWCAYLVVNCVGLRTFWSPLVIVTLVKQFLKEYRLKWYGPFETFANLLLHGPHACLRSCGIGPVCFIGRWCTRPLNWALVS